MYRTPTESSPLLVVAAGGVVIAYRRSDGSVAWRHQAAGAHESDQFYCSRCEVHGDQVIVVSIRAVGGANPRGNGRVTCLDYATGRPLWENVIADNLPLGRNRGATTATLLVEHHQVMVSYGQGLFAFALADGAPQWQQRFDPGLVDGHQPVGVALALPGQAAQGNVS